MFVQSSRNWTLCRSEGPLPVSAATKADSQAGPQGAGKETADNRAAALLVRLGVGLPRREALWKGCWGAFGGGGGGRPEFAWSRACCCWGVDARGEALDGEPLPPAAAPRRAKPSPQGRVGGAPSRRPREHGHEVLVVIGTTLVDNRRAPATARGRVGKSRGGAARRIAARPAACAAGGAPPAQPRRGSPGRRQPPRSFVPTRAAAARRCCGARAGARGGLIGGIRRAGRGSRPAPRRRAALRARSARQDPAQLARRQRFSVRERRVARARSQCAMAALS